MPALWLLVIVLILAAAGFVAGRSRAMADAQGDVRNLHSLPVYYGNHVMLAVLLPAVLILGIWLLLQPLAATQVASSHISPDSYADTGALSLIMSDVQRVAEGLNRAVAQGLISASDANALDATTTDVRALSVSAGVPVAAQVTPDMLAAAEAVRHVSAIGSWLMSGVVLAVALVAGFVAWSQITKDFRARNTVERVVKGLLILAAMIAILTTVGIVLSLLGNTIRFFGLYPAMDFFFGTTWAPSFGGGSELGILPLFWGTFYISIVALIVAVPVGLFAAIYLSEYAGPKVRAFAKPLLEVLAGIPTIVYGLFALLTVGPLLMKLFGQDGTFGVTWMQGGTSVMTAGLVMGVMLIPFVSSLSDDIINAVPQSMRDGSLGLGATKSETVRQVVLPAALPGIVGAILLAASRAIGETMIVVLGAGAAARLSMNPLDAMTTVTTRIVSQLTGDADFASPEALVAFALGMTLFVMTLGLNIFALYIVRKYREQYD
ncbi:Phosphate transport system permease protein PstC [Aquimixticola soesokkakensis]|uniref:Phosphate transport system permease protein n=1 Tax=Aquimixticola soesokkakensis TaxID=1519096 RepID=A0A1Y5SH52_9RHOB|nr:phosphate ABC transporter permease subunit PstC [Aquimixticola soesokkakensis]SLN40720.1 Phosphate transport system permease protein PstC [Aquimixticola soesokkakensis]